jgi:hypothetical protein
MRVFTVNQSEHADPGQAGKEFYFESLVVLSIRYYHRRRPAAVNIRRAGSLPHCEGQRRADARLRLLRA